VETSRTWMMGLKTCSLVNLNLIDQTFEWSWGSWNAFPIMEKLAGRDRRCWVGSRRTSARAGARPFACLEIPAALGPWTDHVVQKYFPSKMNKSDNVMFVRRAPFKWIIFSLTNHAAFSWVTLIKFGNAPPCLNKQRSSGSGGLLLCVQLKSRFSVSVMAR